VRAADTGAGFEEVEAAVALGADKLRVTDAAFEPEGIVELAG
jgi:hypothetical protein